MLILSLQFVPLAAIKLIMETPNFGSDGSSDSNLKKKKKKKKKNRCDDQKRGLNCED